jgi:hypothetical protein
VRSGERDRPFGVAATPARGRNAYIRAFYAPSVRTSGSQRRTRAPKCRFGPGRVALCRLQNRRFVLDPRPRQGCASRVPDPSCTTCGSRFLGDSCRAGLVTVVDSIPIVLCSIVTGLCSKCGWQRVAKWVCFVGCSLFRALVRYCSKWGGMFSDVPTRAEPWSGPTFGSPGEVWSSLSTLSPRPAGTTCGGCRCPALRLR